MHEQKVMTEWLYMRSTTNERLVEEFEWAKKFRFPAPKTSKNYEN